MRLFNSALLAAIFTAAAAPAILAQSPDLILFHGTILTGEGLKEAKPQIVSAIAVSGDKVLAVGSDVEIKRLAGPHTTVRDLNGAFAMPGLNDAHVYLGGA